MWPDPYSAKGPPQYLKSSNGGWDGPCRAETNPHNSSKSTCTVLLPGLITPFLLLKGHVVSEKTSTLCNRLPKHLGKLPVVLVFLSGIKGQSSRSGSVWAWLSGRSMDVLWLSMYLLKPTSAVAFTALSKMCMQTAS